MSDWIVQYGWAFLVGVSVKALALVVAAGLVALAGRRASAAARHMVWRLCLAGLLILPGMTLVLPRVSIPVPAEASSAMPVVLRIMPFRSRCSRCAGAQSDAHFLSASLKSQALRFPLPCRGRFTPSGFGRSVRSWP